MCLLVRGEKSPDGRTVDAILRLSHIDLVIIDNVLTGIAPPWLRRELLVLRIFFSHWNVSVGLSNVSRSSSFVNPRPCDCTVRCSFDVICPAMKR